MEAKDTAKQIIDCIDDIRQGCTEIDRKEDAYLATIADLRKQLAECREAEQTHCISCMWDLFRSRATAERPDDMCIQAIRVFALEVEASIHGAIPGPPDEVSDRLYEEKRDRVTEKDSHDQLPLHTRWPRPQRPGH